MLAWSFRQSQHVLDPFGPANRLCLSVALTFFRSTNTLNLLNWKRPNLSFSALPARLGCALPSEFEKKNPRMGDWKKKILLHSRGEKFVLPLMINAPIHCKSPLPWSTTDNGGWKTLFTRELLIDGSYDMIILRGLPRTGPRPDRADYQIRSSPQPGARYLILEYDCRQPGQSVWWTAYQTDAAIEWYLANGTSASKNQSS